MSLIVSRLSNAARSKKPGREAGKGHWKEMFEELDLGLEKELFCCSAQMFLENVPREYWSEYQREIVGDRKDYAAIAEEQELHIRHLTMDKIAKQIKVP